MLKHLIKKIVGTKNERELKRLRPRVETINALEPEIRRLSDTDLKGKTTTLRERVATALPSTNGGGTDTEEESRADSEARKAVLEEILPGAFAWEISRPSL